MTIIIERKAEIGREQRNTRPARIYDGDFGVKMNAIRFEIWYISTEMAVAPILKNVVYNSASTAQVLMRAGANRIVSHLVWFANSFAIDEWSHRTACDWRTDRWQIGGISVHCVLLSSNGVVINRNLRSNLFYLISK